MCTNLKPEQISLKHRLLLCTTHAHTHTQQTNKITKTSVTAYLDAVTRESTALLVLQQGAIHNLRHNTSAQITQRPAKQEQSPKIWRLNKASSPHRIQSELNCFNTKHTEQEISHCTVPYTYFKPLTARNSIIYNASIGRVFDQINAEGSFYPNRKRLKA